MFTKASTVAFKGEQRLSGANIKELRRAVGARFGGDEVASALFPPKAAIVLRKLGGGSNASFIFADGLCLLVQPDGRADVDKAELIPTLPALWRAVDASLVLPVVLMERPVARFVFRGADLMGPGILAVRPVRGTSALPAVGDLVAVVAAGNPSACAVGRLRQEAMSLGGARGTRIQGVGVQVLHYFGDCLWEACGSPRPLGFVGDRVDATEAPPDGAGADGSEDGSDAEPAPVSGAADDAGAGDGASVGGNAAGGAADVFHPPERSLQAPAERGDQEATGSAGGISGGAAAPSPEAMSKALEQCFLQAARTRLKEKDMPIKGNELYAQHIRPCRRSDMNIDVKASSFKKLVTFLTHCEAQGWLALKKNSDEPVVTKIFKDHPDVREWQPWAAEETAEAQDGTSGGASGSRSGGGVAANVKVERVWRIGKLKALVEAIASEDVKEASRDAVWSREELIDALRQYAERKDLWQKQNRKRIAPDEMLQSLPGVDKEQAAYSLEGLADAMLEKLPACHRVEVPQGGAAGGILRKVREGKPPSVGVKTEKRRGHDVTTVHGLEAYGVDMEAFAGCLKKALASTVKVEEATPERQAGIMVQGCWNVACADWLVKIGIPADSVQDQAKKGLQQKKVKQGSNIVKH